MAHLNPEKLHVKIDGLNGTLDPLMRKYTLTHSDTTGELFLTIGREYDQDAISGWYTKLMRDEVLAEWADSEGLILHIHLHVSGGLVFGPAKWRESIFKSHLPLVLEAICTGDLDFIAEKEACMKAPIHVHFHARQAALDHVEVWGQVKDNLIR